MKQLQNRTGPIVERADATKDLEILQNDIREQTRWSSRKIIEKTLKKVWMIPRIGFIKLWSSS